MNFAPFLHNLSAYQPKTINSNTKLAAVAIILINKPDDVELLLIQRAKHPNDPWSGQIGLPGGRYENSDQDLIQTSIRETLEETQVSLQKSHLITQLDDQQGYAEGGKIDLTIRPFIYSLQHTPVVNANYEVSDYYWIQLSHLLDECNHFYFTPMPGYANRPGVKINHRNMLWGMTYRIISDFFKAAQIPSSLVGD